MEDHAIVSLFWQRDERAITAADAKYGAFCLAIAYNILGNREDSEECRNDTWLRTWNSIPPQKPLSLRAFVARITRNLALDRYRADHSLKRGGGELPLVLDELSLCAADLATPADEARTVALKESISRFLAALPARERDIFVARYVLVTPVRTIAQQLHLKERHVSSLLSRTRERLRKYLREEDFDV